MTTAAMQTALSAESFTRFYALKIALPAATVRLLDGAGAPLTVNGETFTSVDATYGTVSAIDGMADGGDAEAPSLKVLLLPPNLAGVTVWSLPANQGAAVTLWEGLVNRSTGAVVADPEVQFIGQFDVPTLEVTRNGRTVNLECVSVFELFFQDDEGARLNDGFHQSVWPGEKGLEGVTRTTRTIYWGVDRPGSASASGGGGSNTTIRAIRKVIMHIL